MNMKFSLLTIWIVQAGLLLALPFKVRVSFVCRCDVFLYYIFEAILILFLVIFEDDKNDNFLRGDKSLRTIKRTESRQNRIKDVT